MNRLDEEILKVLNEDMTHDELVKYFSERANELFDTYENQGFNRILEIDYATFIFKSSNPDDKDLAVYFYDDDLDFVRLALTTENKKDYRLYPISFEHALNINDIRKFLESRS